MIAWIVSWFGPRGWEPAPPQTRPLCRRFMTAVAVIAGLLAPLPTHADNTDQARQFVDKLGGKVLEILRAPEISLAERQQRFRSLFLEAFDAPAIGRFVLGYQWRELNPEQQAKYLETFSAYVATIYAIQFSSYAGETFKVTDAQSQSEFDTLVNTAIAKPDKQQLRLQFRARVGDGGIKILDVIVEGVSLIVTKRSEFVSVLQREGFDNLMKRMDHAVQQIQSAKS